MFDLQVCTFLLAGRIPAKATKHLYSLTAIRVQAGMETMMLVLFGFVCTHNRNTIWANCLILSHLIYMGTVSNIRTRKKDGIVGTFN